MAQPPNALLTRFHLAALTAAFIVVFILNLITERSVSAPARCRLWLERLDAQNKLNTRLTHHPKRAFACL